MRNTKNIKKNNIFLVYFYLLDLLITKEIKCVKFQKEHLEITFSWNILATPKIVPICRVRK